MGLCSSNEGGYGTNIARHKVAGCIANMLSGKYTIQTLNKQIGNFNSLIRNLDLTYNQVNLDPKHSIQ